MAKKKKGLGVLLQASISGVYTTIASRIEIDGPDKSVGVKELNDLDSTHVERGPTLPDSGDVSLKVWLDLSDATHTYLETCSDVPPSPNPLFKLVIPDTPANVERYFSGIVSGFKYGGMSPDDYIQADVKISIDGGVSATAPV